MEGVVRWPRQFEERYQRLGHWEGITLGEHFDRWVAQYADRIALLYEGKEISYREMGDCATRLAYQLTELGVKTYDRVIVQSFNYPDLVYLLYACMKIGAIPVCTLPTHRWAEICYLARETEARVHVIPAGEVKGFDFEDFAARIRDECPSVQRILTVGESKRPGLISIRHLIDSPLDLAEVKAKLAQYRPDPMEPAIFQLSGGTTGTPKIIPRTHNDYYLNAKCIAEAMQHETDERAICVLPLVHNGPLQNGLLPLHISGAALALTASLAPESVLRAIALNKVTQFGAAVAQFYRLLEVPAEVREKYDVRSVRYIFWSGNLDREALAALSAMFPANIGQNYGMAEGLICLTRQTDPLEVKLYTQGRPVCEADEVRIVDINTGQELPAGEVGELQCRGPYTIRGYYKAPERNKEAFTADGFYKTGDLAKKDTQGNITWMGRIKDCIDRGGEKVNAEEVEACVRQLHKVRDVAVVAFPDRVLGERICAFVVPQPGQSVTSDELTAFLLNEVRIAKFKVPERLELVDELPLTNLGKAVDKKALREQIAGKLRSEGQT